MVPPGFELLLAMSKWDASACRNGIHRDLTATEAMYGSEDGKKFMPGRLPDL